MIAAPAPPPSSLEVDHAARLLRRLDAASANATAESMAALRAVVTEYVDRLKGAGLPQERVVATVEVLVGDRASRARHGETVAHRRVLEWCADAYRDDDWW